jgi:DNA helicase-2/ATP-dependent DNA helicase PcrA
MTLSTSRSIVSAAGSGKTTLVVEDAISRPGEKIALLTYTNNNESEIRKKFYELYGAIPNHVVIATWFQFLLSECVRPYQNFVYDKHRIESLDFVNGKSALYVPKSNVDRYYFNQGRYIYSDKISEFACLCNQKSGGRVINRLKNIFDHIFIDEVQDLAGYDFELLDLFLRAKIPMLLVGDNRQSTYATNNSEKNKKYKGIHIVDLLEKWQKSGLCEKSYLTISYRCNQKICDIADHLYPDMPATLSKNEKITGHDGVFVVSEELAEQYISEYSPEILRYDVRTDCNGHNAMNFGSSKGLTFDRVLIFPNGPIKKYMSSGDIENVMKSRAKLYVAITRAKYSVAFVFSGQCDGCFERWKAT